MISALIFCRGFMKREGTGYLEIDYRDLIYTIEMRQAILYMQWPYNCPWISDYDFVFDSQITDQYQVIRFLRNRIKILRSFFPSEQIVFFFEGPLEPLLTEAGATDLAPLDTFGALRDYNPHLHCEHFPKINEILTRWCSRSIMQYVILGEVLNNTLLTEAGATDSFRAFRDYIPLDFEYLGLKYDFGFVERLAEKRNMVVGQFVMQHKILEEVFRDVDGPKKGVEKFLLLVKKINNDSNLIPNSKVKKLVDSLYFLSAVKVVQIWKDENNIKKLQLPKLIVKDLIDNYIL